MIDVNKIDQYEQLYGGSAAELYLIQDPPSPCVLKMARREGVENGITKLAHEIEFLKERNHEKNPHFPLVLQSYISSQLVWYVMPYYHDKALLYKIIDRRESCDYQVEHFLEHLISGLFQKIYLKDLQKAEEDFILKRHITRVKRRLQQASQMDPLVQKIGQHEEITINQKRLLNWKPLFDLIENQTDLIQKMSPHYYSLTHDDLTIENILLDRENMNNFVLIDPRGIQDTGKYRDYIYDWGKLICTLNGFVPIKNGEFQFEQPKNGHYNYWF